MKDATIGRGFFFAILSFSTWGFLPLYWKLLVAIDPFHILSFRLLSSLVLVAIILLAKRNTVWLTVFKEPKKAAFLILTGAVLTFNWGLYIWAVNTGHTLAASLGYYINPLVSIVLGLLFFHERLKFLQWAAVAFALIGVLILTVLSGALPWISLGLAIAFGFYGLLKKKVPLSALESLGAETLASAPFALLLLCFKFEAGADGSSFPVFSGLQGLAYLSLISPGTWVLLVLTGVVSAFPLYCFAQGAKLLPLSSLGFTQFISPTIQFVVGVYVFHEAFSTHNFAAFAFIWTAVIIYIVSLRRQMAKT